MLAGTGGRAARAFVESFAQIELGGAQRGNDAEEHAGVESDRGALRDTTGGNFQKRADGSPDDEYAKHASRERQHDAFGQKLANDATAARAQGRANCDFPAA